MSPFRMVRLDGYEVILGSSVDAQFGPVLLFGSGGQLVEVYRDRALALPPLNTTLARRLMERTKKFSAFRGIRGRAPVDLAALDKLLVRFSRLVVVQRWIREIDINPLLDSAEKIVALDARVIVYPADIREQDLPKTRHPAVPCAIHGEYRTAHKRLTRICFIDYDREIALVAELKDPDSGSRRILGIGRLANLRDPDVAEFAVLVSDRVQGLGLGIELLRGLVSAGQRTFR